eukprot:TRINITY_DN1009_c2_g1_i1.p1 TRINITY_DN1009_c2_g1~~TRINITY_DN1009_c2_g1_i1.p1  ORF type:complete len:334 (+),score=33.06 TRINITY_DN1009_c2_g1_i1:42-1004(+)
MLSVKSPSVWSSREASWQEEEVEQSTMWNSQLSSTETMCSVQPSPVGELYKNKIKSRMAKASLVTKHDNYERRKKEKDRLQKERSLIEERKREEWRAARKVKVQEYNKLLLQICELTPQSVLDERRDELRKSKSYYGDAKKILSQPFPPSLQRRAQNFEELESIIQHASTCCSNLRKALSYFDNAVAHRMEMLLKPSDDRVTRQELRAAEREAAYKSEISNRERRKQFKEEQVANEEKVANKVCPQVSLRTRRPPTLMLRTIATNFAPDVYISGVNCYGPRRTESVGEPMDPFELGKSPHARLSKYLNPRKRRSEKRWLD